MKAIASRKGPAPLAPAVKQQALDGKIGTPFATVSVGRLIEPNKARIEVWTPILVNSLTLANGVPRILFTSSQEWEQSNDLFHPTLFVFINSPAAGNFYLVDCSVTPGPYTIEGPSGTQTTQVEDGHLLFHLDQAALGWQSFRITSADQWEFYSCSILQLN
jgi:hypothetical protein